MRINKDIAADPVRLIDQDGEQHGLIALSDAMNKAQSVELDLVEIAPNSTPPVCRIMDYGKYQFDKGKKKLNQKKTQRKVQLKEIKFRPVTDVGDFKVKLDKIKKFLERGDRVKITVRFRGREMQHRELGMEMFAKIKQDLPENLVIEQEPQLEGRQMVMILLLGKGVKS